MKHLRNFLFATTLAPLAAFGQFTLVETGGTFRTDATNLALSATAISQDEYGYPHYTENINDGAYGNSSSWIGADVRGLEFNPDSGAFEERVVTTVSDKSWVGLQFAAPVTIRSIAFGRDNLGVYGDRAFYGIQIQYTTATASWVDYGDISPSVLPSPALRHLFNLDTPLTGVTGLRLYTTTGGTFGNAFDELEVYATAAAIPEPSTYAALAGLGALGLAIWRRRQGRRT